MEQTRLHTEETKGKATQGNSTWRTGMAAKIKHETLTETFRA